MKDLTYQTIKIEKFEHENFLVSIQNLQIQENNIFPLLVSENLELLSLEEINQITG